MKIQSRICFVMIVTAVLFVQASEIFAYSLRSENGCNQIRFSLPPTIVFHNSGMLGHYTLDEIQAAKQSILDAQALFNEIGGTWITIGAVTESPFPFVFKQWYGDILPTIHIGWTSDSSLTKPGATSWDIDASTCTIREAHIYIKNPSAFSASATKVIWEFGDPEDYGELYFDAGWSPSGSSTGSEVHQYLNITIVHELMHAFGVAHSNDGLAILNTGDRGWANRDYGKKMRPFPDDIQAIRYLYPAGFHRTEIGLLNTWYTPSASSDPYPSAIQKKLCKPSLGLFWSGDRFNEFCGTNGVSNGSTQVCPGDSLFTRVAVLNYGTKSLDVTMRLFFSEDEHWNGFNGVDVISPDRFEFPLPAAGSSQQGRVYEVPTGLAYGREYRPIIRVRGVEPDGDITTDWIPLRGTVSVKRYLDCNEIGATPR